VIEHVYDGMDESVQEVHDNLSWHYQCTIVRSLYVAYVLREYLRLRMI